MSDSDVGRVIDEIINIVKPVKNNGGYSLLTG
jgi:hypothetical protein